MRITSVDIYTLSIPFEHPLVVSPTTPVIGAEFDETMLENKIIVS